MLAAEHQGMNPPESIRLTILSETMNTETLAIALRGHLSEVLEPFQLFSEPSGLRLRALEPSVLVAIVGASGATVGALITGLLNMARERKQESFVIQSKSGAKLEVPAGTSQETISMLIQKIREMDEPRVIL
jgi:hypothetical protein